MKTIFGAFFITLTLALAPVLHAAPTTKTASAAPQTPSATVLSDYITLQQKLAADTLEGVPEAARSIEKNSKTPEIQDSARKIAAAKTIVEARTEFKALSKPISNWMQTAKKPGYEVYHCSMASAKWVQKKGSTSNPYYGKEMLDCGDKLTD